MSSNMRDFVVNLVADIDFVAIELDESDSNTLALIIAAVLRSRQPGQMEVVVLLKQSAPLYTREFIARVHNEVKGLYPGVPLELTQPGDRLALRRTGPDGHNEDDGLVIITESGYKTMVRVRDGGEAIEEKATEPGSMGEYGGTMEPESDLTDTLDTEILAEGGTDAKKEGHTMKALARYRDRNEGGGIELHDSIAGSGEKGKRQEEASQENQSLDNEAVDEDLAGFGVPRRGFMTTQGVMVANTPQASSQESSKVLEGVLVPNTP